MKSHMLSLIKHVPSMYRQEALELAHISKSMGFIIVSTPTDASCLFAAISTLLPTIGHERVGCIIPPTKPTNR